MQYPITNDMMASPEPGDDENSDNDGEDGTTDSNGDPIDDSGDDPGFEISAMMTMSFTTSDGPDYDSITDHPLATHPRPPKQKSISSLVDFNSINGPLFWPDLCTKASYTTPKSSVPPDATDFPHATHPRPPKQQSIDSAYFPSTTIYVCDSLTDPITYPNTVFHTESTSEDSPTVTDSPTTTEPISRPDHPFATHPRLRKQWSPSMDGLSLDVAVTAPPVPPGNPSESRLLTIMGQQDTTV
jgi:hypothetical protein